MIFHSNFCATYATMLRQGVWWQVQISMLPELTECCNRHDRCYDTCGSNKIVCDQQFKNCVQELCSISSVQLITTRSANLHDGGY